MNTSKLLAVAFAASLVGSAALAQTQAATDDTSVQVQPAQTQAAEPELMQPTFSHPAMRVQGMVPADMVYEIAQPDTVALTRDEVKAELVAARAEGELSTEADNHGPLIRDEEFIGIRTRDEVKNEIALARADHELNTASDNGPVERVFYVSTKTRADVKAETISAMASGQNLSQGDRSMY
ncbi:MAG TPA: hypothetical protein VLA61_07655 [Ideonella sp.]|uniref:hypothetical protein n=1 Tax=Ideonella sp. TaxID=1929293 RepID=UPI002C654343|nr:hypothetical protein [Ideonella sp.]HSI48126.1 hypothetical protein [Ideonella sp.]